MKNTTPLTSAAPALTHAERILVVNDAPDQLEFAKFVLSDAGYRVVTASNGADALNIAGREQPDLVLSDVVMPAMDGIELCRQLRASSDLASTPVLLMSGLRKDSESATAGIRAGADGYLEVPFDPIQLVSKVGRLLERRRAEERVRRQLAFTQAITASLGEAVCAMDDEFLVTFMNPAAEAALGCPSESLLGKPIFEAVAIEDEDLTAAMPCPLLAALETGTTGRFESGVFRRRDGGRFPAAYTVSPIRSGAQIVGTVLAFHDITERARADERLRNEQRALKEAQRLAQLGSWSWKRDEEVVTWSDELFRIAGRDRQLGGPTCAAQEALFGTNGDTLTRAVQRTLATGEPFEVEVEVLRHDGHHRWIIARGEARRSQGQIVGLHGTAQDVTERRREHRLLQLSEQRQTQQREMLELANQRLEHSERRYRDLVENLDDVVFALDTEGGFQYVSPSVQRYGYTPQELLARPFSSVVHAEDVEGLQRALQTPAGAVEPREFRIVDRTGAIHHVRASSRSVFDNGRYAGVTGVIIDVTAQRRAEEQLRAAQRLEAVGRLAGGVAHDFNNLLVAINGYAEFAMEAVHPADPMRADLEEILKAGNRAAALTRQLLAFSRKQVLKPEVLNLNDVVKGMEGMLRRLIGEDIDFHVVTHPTVARVLADPGQMEQVIMNLVVNARDAMPTGGTLIIATAKGEETEVCGPQGGPCVVLSVTDTGCGMDEQTKAQIFDPFFSTKGPGEGTGLGLATVHGIVNQSGGTVTVETAPGKGARFNVILPCAQEGPKTRVGQGAARARRGTETILLVEDEHPVRELAKRFLTTAGYRVLAASNGGEALLMCESHSGPIDLLVTDVVMPMMSGRELWERLTIIRPGLRVVYMSGYSGTAIAHRGLLADGIRLVEKPFSGAELTRSVGQALDEAPVDE